MKARDLMVHPVASVGVTDSLARAAGLMRDRECGAVVVLGSDSLVVGMLTDRDVCLAALRTGTALSQLVVAQAMSSRLFTCAPEDDLLTVVDIMSLHRVRRLPVVDGRKRLIGIVSLDDVARAANRQADLIAPHVSVREVGRTVGEICRPGLVGTGAEDAAPASGGSR